MLLLRSLSVLGLGILMAGVASADVTYVCTYGQQERLIAVIYAQQGKPVPCEVRYTKEGTTEVLWNASTESGYCEAKAQAFVDQHLEWGWRCGGGTVGDLPQIGTGSQLSAAEVDGYRRNAHIANAIATASPMRFQVIEYYMDHGQYPSGVEALGLRPADMRTSAHFSDLRIGEQGAILIKGNENTGVDTVIALRPRESLGGMSMEWDCAINVEVGSAIHCGYEPGLRFR